MTQQHDIAKIADGLSSEARAALLDGAACDTAQELLDAGLWKPEFPPEKHPDLKQEYFLTTPLGLRVRDYLRSKDDD